MPPMQVIGITGLARSGKDTLADYLEQKYGYKKYVFSDILKTRLQEQGKEATKENMSKLGDELRKMHGEGILAELLLKKAHEQKSQKIAAVGVRSPACVRYLKENSSLFMLIEIRAQRTDRESRQADSTDKVSSRDERDIKNKGLDKVFAMSDHVIINDSTLESLYSKIDEIIRKGAKK